MWPAVDTRDTREIEWAARTTRELTPDLYVVLITGRKTREYGRRSQAGENCEQAHRHACVRVGHFSSFFFLFSKRVLRVAKEE